MGRNRGQRQWLDQTTTIGLGNGGSRAFRAQPSEVELHTVNRHDESNQVSANILDKETIHFDQAIDGNIGNLVAAANRPHLPGCEPTSRAKQVGCVRCWSGGAVKQRWTKCRSKGNAGKLSHQGTTSSTHLPVASCLIAFRILGCP